MDCSPQLPIRYFFNKINNIFNFKFGQNSPVCYALEGSGSIGGNVVRFLRDNLQFFKEADEIEQLAGSVDTTEDVYFGKLELIDKNNLFFSSLLHWSLHSSMGPIGPRHHLWANPIGHSCAHLPGCPQSRRIPNTGNGGSRRTWHGRYSRSLT